MPRFDLNTAATSRKITNAPAADVIQKPYQLRVTFSPVPVVNRSTVTPESNEPKKHSDTVREELNKSLGRSAKMRRRFLIGVQLSCHEEKVVTNAVQQDCHIKKERQFAGIADG